MSRHDPLKANVRHARFEHVEERLVLSASPWPALTHHAALDNVAAEQATPMVDVGGQASLENTMGGIAIAPHLNGAHAATGVNVAHADYGFHGEGQTVVVIDSGIAYDHEALGGGFGAGNRVVGGWDFAENDANPYDDAPAGFHGTHVAGIIGSDDARYTGVASQVDLVALRVFDDSGNGNFQWVEEALDWVIANQGTFENPITTVNLSLGVPHMNVDDAPAWAKFANGLESKFGALYDAGIFVAVSAGNDFAEFNAKGLSYPAVSDWVVPVSSSNDAGTRLSDFSQRDDHVLTAPGESITSTVPDELFSFDGRKNDWASASGTSMASPYVAGASVLIREAYEFMGVTDVDQQMIYDVLFDTASIINDPITSGSYHFIDVEAALGTIVTDTFANDAATATAMGMMGDGYTFGEQIGQLNDRDYFSFVAEQSGTMTLSAAVTHDLAAHWDLVGGGGTVHDGNLTFDVVAGQSYTVGLMTDAGVGHYTVESRIEASTIDLGTVERTQLNGITIAGEQWYTLAASRTGILTMEANFGTRDAVAVEIYDADLQRIDTVAAKSGYFRADAQVEAGETLFVRLAGTGEVDLNAWNIVGLTGERADIHGTSSDDVFAVFAGTTHRVYVNGLRYDFENTSVTDIRVLGKGGEDQIRVVGTNGDDKAVIRVGSATVTGEGYRVRATDIERINVNGGGGTDIAYLYDSAGDDRFVAKPDYAALSGDGFYNFTRGFENARAIANAGGDDIAYLYDSAGDDRFVAKPDYAALSGDGFYNFTRGFENARAIANAGGDNIAYLYDSAGDDRFVAKPDYAALSGDGFYNFARGFENARAIANAGGNDRAILYDSIGDDRFEAHKEFALLAGDGFRNFARDFESTRAVASTGGEDIASFYQCDTIDDFIGTRSSGDLQRRDTNQSTRGFEHVGVYATLGENPTLELDAVNYLFSLVGDWV